MDHTFLLGCHKAGTSLLRSLFDGHPSTFAVPYETHFFTHLGWWCEYPLRRNQPESISLVESADRMIEWVRQVNVGESTQLGNYSDNNASGVWEVEQIDGDLKAALENDPDLSIPDMYEHLLRALAPSIGLEPLGRMSFEKSVENFTLAPRIAREFPDARFVHILRNPYANYVALRRRKEKGFFPRELAAIRASCVMAATNEATIGSDRYRTIKYESLVANPESVMHDLADFLELDFDNSFLHPTELSQPWDGNSTFCQSQATVSEVAANRWKKDIRPFEVALVTAGLGPALRYWGYEVVSPNSTGWLPSRIENPATYVLNRMLRSFLERWNEADQSNPQLNLTSSRLAESDD